MLNFGASKPRVRGGPGPRGPPLDPHLFSTSLHSLRMAKNTQSIYQQINSLPSALNYNEITEKMVQIFPQNFLENSILCEFINLNTKKT